MNQNFALMPVLAKDGLFDAPGADGTPQATTISPLVTLSAR